MLRRELVLLFHMRCSRGSVAGPRNPTPEELLGYKPAEVDSGQLYADQDSRVGLSPT